MLSSNTPPTQAPVARKVKKSEFVGKGALVQAIGLGCCFLVVPFGIIVGIILLVIGGRMAFVWKCSHCGNKIDKDSRICPHPNCGARFD
jgi:hypothetical protein